MLYYEFGFKLNYLWAPSASFVQQSRVTRRAYRPPSSSTLIQGDRVMIMVRHRTGAPMPIPGSDVTLSRDLALTIAGRGDTTTETADQMLRRNKKKTLNFSKMCSRHPPWTTCRTQIPILRTHLGPRNVLFLFARWFMLRLISQIAPMYKLTPDHWEFLRLICIKFGWEMSFQFTLVESNASMRAQARFSIHQSSQ